MKFLPFLLSSVVLAMGALPGRSEITLAPLFGDHAVLQREKPVPVWGTANPGEKISVKFGGQVVGSTADARGHWIVYLEPLAASAEAATLTVSGKDSEIALQDIVVGEVWLASGQSNMEWPVSYLRDDEKRLTAIDLPLVRQLRIEHTVAPAPAFTVKTSGWQPATPQLVGNFSAVGYFFAREVQRKLGVPVGLIHSSWGGTEIEAWLSDAVRAETSLGATIDARWQRAMSEWSPERVARYPADLAAWQKADEEAKVAKKKNPLPWPQPPATPDSPRRPGGLFNAMIAPLQPGALRGFIWYQGESNIDRPAEYPELFEALIKSWRANWGAPQSPSAPANAAASDAIPPMPFYFVQLPNYADGNAGGRKWARFREAQARVFALPMTGMAVAIDVGEAQNLHPTSKLEIGRRLALIAKAEVYGLPGDFSGPVFAGATREGAALRVSFTRAGSGIVAHDRPPQALEIAGADKVFHAAQARIDRNSLLVSSPAVKEPVAVRYAWSNAPVANLYSGAGLPVAPFRSDNW